MSDTKDKALKSIFKGGAIVFIGSILSKFITLLYRILVGQTGVAEYGQISVMMAVFTTALLFAQLGIPNGVQRYVAYYLGRDERDKAIGSFQTGLRIITISSLLTGVSLFLLAPWLAIEIFNNSNLTLLIRIVAIAIPFRAYGSITMQLTDALEKMQYSVINDKIFVNAAQLGLAALLIYYSYGYLGAAVAYAVTFILGGLMAIYFAYREFPEMFTSKSNFSNFDDLFSHSWPLIVAGMFGKITGNIDTFMIQSFISSEKVGLYQAAFPFASSLTIASGMFGGILLSNASELVSKNENETLASTYRTVVKWSTVIIVPMFLIVFAFPKTVLSLFGPEYYEAANLLRILAVGFLLSGMVGPIGNMYQALGKTKLNLLAAAIIGILNLGFNAILIPLMGVEGAAWASTGAILLSSIIGLVILYHVIGVQPFKKSVTKVWSSGILAISIVYLLTNALFPVTPMWFLPVDIALLGVLYLSFMIAFRTLEEDDLTIAKAVGNKAGFKEERVENIARKIM